MTVDRSEAAGTVKFLFEAGVLRNIPRTGWGYDGIQHAETVAEHSHRTTIVGAVLASMEGADPARTALLGALHDTQEARIGDVTPLGRRYVQVADNRSVTAEQLAGAHPAVRAALEGAVDEYETGETPEARCARDADKLDCLLRALEYQHQGYVSVQGKVERCYAALKTASAKQLADAALGMAPTDWQEATFPSGTRR